MDQQQAILQALLNKTPNPQLMPGGNAYSGADGLGAATQQTMPLLQDVSKAMTPEQLQQMLGAPMYTPQDAITPPPFTGR